jgi:nucleotide-binding universal stress UspA family protein
MFTKIIWATDGSEAADLALPYAKTLAEGPGRVLVAVHVKEFFRGRASAYPVLADEAELVTKIRRQVEETQADGITTSLHIADASAPGGARMIAKVARDVDADIIVVGTRGHSAIGALVLGSVTQQLLHIAPCPVLAVPGGSQTTEDELAPEHEMVSQ